MEGGFGIAVVGKLAGGAMLLLQVPDPNPSSLFLRYKNLNRKPTGAMIPGFGKL